MKRKIKVEQEIEIAFAECRIYARYWQDAYVNGVKDDAENPKMPFVEEHNGEKEWHIKINLDNGQICNWPQGTTAKVHYKSCDCNEVQILDRQLGIIKDYDGYVPTFLCPEGNGFGDYVIMNIDENGFIQNFNPVLDDIFDED